MAHPPRPSWPTRTVLSIWSIQRSFQRSVSLDTNKGYSWMTWNGSSGQRGISDRSRPIGRVSPPRNPREKHRRPRGEFIRGPIPLDWSMRALEVCSGSRKAGNLILALWWRNGFSKSEPIRLTAARLQRFLLSPKTAARLLRRMEAAGLLRVDSATGRGPDVTLLDV